MPTPSLHQLRALLATVETGSVSARAFRAWTGIAPAASRRHGAA